MDSENKGYEMTEQKQILFEDEITSDRISLQMLDSPHNVESQNENAPLNQQLHHQYVYQVQIPPHVIQHILSQYARATPQNTGCTSQPLPGITTELDVVSAADLIPKHQEYEQRIQKHRFIVTLNWVMIAVTTIGGIAASISLIELRHLFSCKDNVWENSFCVSVMGIWIGDQFLKQLLIIIIFTSVKTLHYKTIVAYRKRNAEKMAIVFICFTILLSLSLLMLNLIGIVIYGYLAYSTNKLKIAFNRINEIEKKMSREGIMNFHGIRLEDGEIQVSAL